MIAVSDSFKKAIKSDNREIHGYVDIEFFEQNGDYHINSTPDANVLSMQDGSDLLDKNKIMINYGTLENNYFLLDGSFRLPNSNIQHDAGGFISDNVYSNIENPVFTIYSNNNGEITSQGMSLYFKDNLVIDFVLTIVDINDNTTTFNINNNDKYNYYIIFDNPITIKSIELNVSRVEYNDRRLRIAEISLTPSELYEGNELIKFNINEEIDISLTSNPINTCEINLNNYPDYEGGNKFDPINPKGLTAYLTENTKIKPYIGVLTENEGVEYVSMGTYYLTDWSSDVDGNVTLKGQDVLGVFKNKPMLSKQGLLNESHVENIQSALESLYGIDFDLSDLSGSDMEILKETDMFNWLASACITNSYYEYDSGVIRYILKADRNNTITQSANQSNYIADSLSRNMFLQDVEYTTKSQVNIVELKYIKPWNITSTTQEYTLNTTHTLTSTEEYMWFKLNKYTANNPTFSYTTTGSGTATLIDANRYIIYVKLNGTVGETFTLRYYGWSYNDPPVTTKQFTNDLVNGQKMSIDLTNYIWMDDNIANTLATYYLNYDPKYNVSIKSIGLPYLETGDTISVQTRYNDANDGYKNIIITKQTFEYDGGLSCDMEGVST